MSEQPLDLHEIERQIREFGDIPKLDVLALVAEVRRTAARAEQAEARIAAVLALCDEDDATIRRAIGDPGAHSKRQYDSGYGESVASWSARAVKQILRAALGGGQ